MMLPIGDMRQNGIQHHAPPDDPYIYFDKYIIICSYSSHLDLSFSIY